MVRDLDERQRENQSRKNRQQQTEVPAVTPLNRSVLHPVAPNFPPPTSHISYLTSPNTLTPPQILHAKLTQD